MNPNQCINPTTGSLCILFDMDTRECLQPINKSQVKPPYWCPLFKKGNPHQTHENAPGLTFGNPHKPPHKNQESGVTPQFCLCGCGRIVTGRKNKQYFSRKCKDRVKNKARLRAMKILWEIVLLEVEARGYEVHKKGG